MYKKAARMNEFHKVAGYMVSIRTLIPFLCASNEQLDILVVKTVLFIIASKM